MTMIFSAPWRWVRRELRRHRATRESIEAAGSHTSPRPEANLVGLQTRWLGDTILSPERVEIRQGARGTVAAFVEADSYRAVYQIAFDNGATHTTSLPQPHLVELMPPVGENFIGWGARICGGENYAPGSTLRDGSVGTVIRFEVGGNGHRAYVIDFPAEGVELTSELPAPNAVELSSPR